MKKSYITTMPDHIGAFLKASQCFYELGINITRVSYNKAVDSNTLFIDAEGNITVLGADPLYAGETETQGKGSIPIEKGDRIQLLCDYYTYEGDYDGSYTLGKAFTAGSSLTVEYLKLSNADISVSYRLTDIYGNVYWTPAYIY